MSEGELTGVNLASCTGAAAASRPPEGRRVERHRPPGGGVGAGGHGRRCALFGAFALLSACGSPTGTVGPGDAAGASAEDATKPGAAEPAAPGGTAVAPAEAAKAPGGEGGAAVPPAPAPTPAVPSALPLDRGSAFVRVSGAVSATYVPTGLDCLPGVDLGLSIHATRTSPKVLPAWSAVLHPESENTPATLVVTVGERRWGAVVDGSALTATGGALDGVRLDPMPRGTRGEPLMVDVFYRCPVMDTFSVPAPVLATLHAVTGAESRPWNGADYGRNQDQRGASALVSRDDLGERVRTLRGRLPVGWVAFQGTLRDASEGADEKLGEVVVGPGRGAADIVRLGHTSPAHVGLDVEDVALRMEAWTEKYRINVVGADDDSVVTTVARDADIPALAAEAGEFCPDIVRDGPGTVEALTQQIGRTHQLYCWWD